MNKSIAWRQFSIAVIFLVSFSSCHTKSKKTIKYRQYYVQGHRLYTLHCSNCHQPDGKGLARLYPPVRQSDFMENNVEKTICIIRHGMSNKPTVNDKHYNQTMLGFPHLTPLEVAEIATYIYNMEDETKGIIETSYVEKMLKKCKNSAAH